MRVVVDTNVIASAVLSPSGPPARILALVDRGVFELVVSEAILAEYERVLNYPRVRSRHGLTDDELSRFLARLRQVAVLVEPRESLAIVADDPDDNKFLECAVEASATYIVSGDNHLNALGEFRGIQILRPVVFVAVVESE